MGTHLPTFSIVVPTYARPGELAVCLQSMAQLEYPLRLYEVIMVDDGSEMLLEAVVAPFRDRLNLTLVRQPHAGPATARNTGAGRAKGEFLAFTDDDCAPARDWLRTLAARFTIAPDHLIGGRTLNALPENPYSATSQAIVDVVYAYYNSDITSPRFFASNNLAIPADRFGAIGGFDGTFVTSEDRDLCDRWLHHGYRMTYAPEALVYHAHALTFRSFCQQHFNYGRGAFRFHRARARRASGRLTQDLGFYASLLSSPRRPFSQARGRQVLLLAVLLAVWQGVNAAGFVWEWVNQID